uniref:NADH-ubiquinone oxidoreductase chain 2 n=1 Tax=Friesea propria TaxID=2785902 RepID=B5KY10_9HEXA|nr:NADH dehydrogenase subunit 2 [Friesea propria]ABV02141.1 NADH dehydrogenase subunit 2 [Friesea propria]
MLMKFKLLIFLPCVMFGTILSISSASWFAAWVGLEINLMSIAPILINKMTYQSVEATIKYFLTQAIASTVFIFSAMTLSFSQFLALNDFMLNTFMMLAILTKAGVAPLHFWFPQVMECSEWFQCFIILTWQKIAPFIILSFMKLGLIWWFIVSSALLGALGAINQSNFKLILTYSSIIHSSWMLTLILISETMWWVYFLSYSFLTTSIIYLNFLFKLNKLSDLFNLNMSSNLKIILLINFLSIAGLPPFLGFMIKFLSIAMILNSFSIPIFIPLILMASSFISFYFYLRMIYSSLFISSSKNFIMASMNLFNSSTMQFTMFTMISILGNSFIPLLVLLI